MEAVAPPTSPPVEPEVVESQDGDLLGTGAHDPLQGRVARLAEELGPDHEGGQADLNGLLAVAHEPAHAELAVARHPDRRGARDQVQAEQGRDPGSDDPAAAIRAVGAGQDQVVVQRSKDGRQHAHRR